MQVENLYYEKYLKYKNKYVNLQNQNGGVSYNKHQMTKKEEKRRMEKRERENPNIDYAKTNKMIKELEQQILFLNSLPSMTEQQQKELPIMKIMLASIKFRLAHKTGPPKLIAKMKAEFDAVGKENSSQW